MISLEVNSDSLVRTMVPPPMECEVDSCEYVTAANLTTFDNQFKALELHIRMKHPQLAPPPPATQQVPAATGPKPDKLPRPTVNEGIYRLTGFGLRTGGNDTSAPQPSLVRI